MPAAYITGSAAGEVAVIGEAIGDNGVAATAAATISLSGAAAGDYAYDGSVVAEVALTGEAIGEGVFPEVVPDAPAIIRGGRLGSGGPNLVRKPQLEATVGYGVGQISLLGSASGDHKLPNVPAPPTVPTQRQPTVAVDKAFLIYSADDYEAIGSGSGALTMASSATGNVEDGWVEYDNDLVIAA
jgi:hypothetical protein